MTRADILLRVKAKVEEHYSGDDTKFKGVEVINFELPDDGSLLIHVKVSFYGASTVLYGRINDAKDFGVFLTQDELDFLEETASQAPARIAPRTKVSRYVMHLVSQLRHVGGNDSELLCQPSAVFTSALLSNPNLMDLIFHVDVDSIVAYIERILIDLTCDDRSSTVVPWVVSLLSSASLMSIVQHQQYLDAEVMEE